MPELDTQDEPVLTGDEQVTDPNVDPATQGTGDDEYFLTVDDRTRYKTSEDAQKAFKEAGERIATLSTWDKEIGKAYNADPQQVAAALDEYLQMKEAQAQADAQKAAEQGKTADVQATHSVDESKLTPKEREALAWIKKVAPALGFVPKADLDALKTKIDQLETGVAGQSAARLEAQEQEGSGQLKQMITAAKLPTDPKFAMFVENSVAAWVNQSKERVDKWHRGGAGAMALLKEGFEYVTESLSPLRATSAAGYQGKKSGSVHTGPKRLPQVGSSLGQKRPAVAQGAKPTTSDIHNAAWAAANKAWDGATSDGGE